MNIRAAAVASPPIAFVFPAPHLVERSVRGALRLWLQQRRGNDAIEARAFANDALTLLSRYVRDDDAALDPIARHELEGVTLAAAGRFATSRLAARFAEIGASFFESPLDDVDAFVRDACGRRHAVRLESLAKQSDRVALARMPAREAGAIPDALHLFSLRDGRLRSFGPGALAAAPFKALAIRGPYSLEACAPTGTSIS